MRASMAIASILRLFWAAVINGVVAVPIMAVMMLLATRRDLMGQHEIGSRLRVMGWLATAVMGLVVVAMVVAAVRGL